MEIANQLIAILVRELGLNTEQIAEDLRLREDLGMDSIVALNLMFSAERELGIVFTEEEVVGLRTVEDLRRLAFRKDLLGVRDSDR